MNFLFFTITTDAENSVIKDFNNLKVGGISGELNENSSNNVHALVIGSAYSQYKTRISVIRYYYSRMLKLVIFLRGPI